LLIILVTFSSRGSYSCTNSNQSTGEKENDRVKTNHNQHAKHIILEQDVQLGQLGDAVDRLGAIGREVKQELDVSV
jgi:hypothetical protein